MDILLHAANLERLLLLIFVIANKIAHYLPLSGENDPSWVPFVLVIRLCSSNVSLQALHSRYSLVLS